MKVQVKEFSNEKKKKCMHKKFMKLITLILVVVVVRM